MIEKVEKKRLAILRILKEAEQPLTGAAITEELLDLGHEISMRTVRLYLQEMDGEGLTDNLGKKGRSITPQGLEELAHARVIEKLGFLSAKIDQMTYLMSFDLSNRTGTVVINLSFMTPEQLLKGLDDFGRVFSEGYAMGRLVALLEPGERLEDVVVPNDMIGVGTVCSITLNGVLLQKGVPTRSRFGGLLEIQDKKPVRFVEIITYDGTSLDPLEVFIRSGMTDYLGAINNGSGRIGASFREFPAPSRALVSELAEEVEKVGLGGFMTIGLPGRRLLEIPVGEGLVGSVVIGGLNPAAVLEEKGIHVYSRALAGLIDFSRLFHFKELEGRLRRLT